MNQVDGVNSAYQYYNSPAYDQNTAGSSNYGSALQIAGTAKDVFSILGSKAEEEDKNQAIRDRIGLAVADSYTFGLSSLAYGFIHKQWPGFAEKLDKLSAKFDPLLRLANKLFDTDKWKTEGNRLKKLEKQGIEIPEAFRGPMNQTRGKSKEELIDPSVPLDFVGYKSDGSYANNKFAMSRNEADLRPEDIWGYAAFFEKFGNDWLQTFSAEDRRAIAQKALDSGAVREHHGTIDIKWTPELEAFVSQKYA